MSLTVWWLCGCRGSSARSCSRNSSPGQRRLLLLLLLLLCMLCSAAHLECALVSRGRTYVKHATYDQVVPRENYVRVVKRIKRKYNTEWLEKWKTRTDTTKHVYEDINTGLFIPFSSGHSPPEITLCPACCSCVPSCAVRDGENPDRHHARVCLTHILSAVVIMHTSHVFSGTASRRLWTWAVETVFLSTFSRRRGTAALAST